MARYPFIRQLDAMQCGVACLAMVCARYGRRVSSESIDSLCRSTVEGVSLLGMSNAAERLGFHTLNARLSFGQLREAPLPAIAHWRQNHFVVVYAIDRRGRRVTVGDPAKGIVTMSAGEFMNGWCSTSSGGEERGVALLLEPTPAFSSASANAVPPKRSLRFLLGYLNRYKGYMAQIAMGLALGCVLQLILPFLTQYIVDLGIRHADIRLIWLILLGEMMIVAGRTVTDFIRSWLLIHISMRVNISLVSDFFIKLLSLPMGFFETKQMGDLLQRMNDHSRVQSFLTGQTLNVAFTVLSFLVFGSVLLIYDAAIFGVFMAGSAVYGLWTAMFLKRRKVLDYEYFEQQARNSNLTYRFITSMQEIKLQDCERRRRWEWEDVQADQFAVELKSLRMSQTQQAGSIFINETKNILVTVLAATAVIDGGMTLGAMLAVQYIIGQLNSPVVQLMDFIYSLQDVKISLERINQIHDAAPEREGKIPTSFAGGIMLRDVSFRYNPHSPSKTIDSVSIDIPQGKVTAIVGASGSGKTTLLKLILGYYDTESGTIEAGGMNLARLNLRWWRKQCGVVMQDGVIFSESIARNIAVDDGEIDLPRLENAARLACIYDFVMSRPLRFNTAIGPDGSGLSQGQKQRILIARAIYRNPPFILLDEATNSLDANTERVIVENLAEFYRGRTVIVVAHRLSTVSAADNIVVLDHGKVIESGTHRQLTEARGAYYRLVKNQLELGT